jgi:ADP-heptose:LPS heptosyltransferase
LKPSRDIRLRRGLSEPAPRKLILKCEFAPGDIVMLTAAVRDLHRCYPGKFQTDVRTIYPDLWEANPYLTRLADGAPGVEPIDCFYPLINQCKTAPKHCLNGFIEFLNERLGLSIKPTAFKGDIHLTPQEKRWYSQVHEETGEDTPFWIVCAGGKHDVTIKWWQTERYQEVISHFKGRIQFVQVGDIGHYHPKLEGVIDLRGKTTLRELIRLVYHSQGILCSVTCLMHLAAAVETKHGRPSLRPCVVIAGGREPAHWEAYPGHQFIHTIGALRCCATSGCWKDRTVPLNDGDKRDRPEHLCSNVVNQLPRCMDMIAPAEVIRRIETYFDGGTIRYLTPQQFKAAELGVAATRENEYDRLPLNIHFAWLACEKFIGSIPNNPTQRFQGRGIVICGGGAKYFTNAWVCINMLRKLGCKLPIELWHLGETEMTREMEKLVSPLGVKCVDGLALQKTFPARIVRGWALKSYAILHSRFREVLLLDADNVPVANPEILFETPQFKSTGAIFWPDISRRRTKTALSIWRNCGLRPPREPEFESGQIIVDKERCWRALRLCLWFNENSDFYYRYFHGDKDTFQLAFRKTGKNYSLIPTPVRQLDATMCQHDFTDRRIFQHRNLDKWDLFSRNRRIEDFWFEEQCRNFVQQLRQSWSGMLNRSVHQKLNLASRENGHARTTRIETVMISCRQREELRRKTLENFGKTDWGEEPFVQMDDGGQDGGVQRQLRSTRAVLKTALRKRPDYILFLEDDLLFNRHLRHNLLHWNPIKAGVITLASLYNPGLIETGCDVRHNLRIVQPQHIFGSQAFLISRETAEYLLRHWDKGDVGQDLRIAQLAGRLKKPIFYHAPSLVQHVGVQSVWGGRFHQAADFDSEWKAKAS